MVRRSYAVALVAITSVFLWEGPAWAKGKAPAGGDPTKVGKNVEDIVTPNAKSFWEVALIIGALFMVFGRPKGSLVAAYLIGITVSGAIIFNPAGFVNMVQNVGNRLF